MPDRDAFDEKLIAEQIKEQAVFLGFDACGICCAEDVSSTHQEHYNNWLTNNYQAEMGYMERNIDKRFDPRLLVEGAKSVICVALNYYPQTLQKKDAPQFAYYAYGKDYHDVMKAKLQNLLSHIQTLIPSASGRVFCDTAPVLERYWAAKAGLGFIGKNTLLIIPKKGSYLFLGCLIIDQQLAYDAPLKLSCGTCNSCQVACPTKAFEKPYVLNSRKCISYQTIENKQEIDAEITPLLNNRLYGCDACQQVCPWNRFATANQTIDFVPSDNFLALDYQKLANLSVDDYQRIFKGSAVKRAKYQGLMRNLRALTQASD